MLLLKKPLAFLLLVELLQAVVHKKIERTSQLLVMLCTLQTQHGEWQPRYLIAKAIILFTAVSY